MGGNMFDKFFSGDLEALNKAEQSVQGVKVEDPFIKGEDLDWTDEKQAEELYEYGAEARMSGRRG